MLILGIESTCDETGCALVRDGQVLSNKIASQTNLHEYFGGVVPELASREHAKHLLPLLDSALEEAKVTLQELDAIAIAYGPGLIGSLLIGFNTAKVLSLTLNKPLLCINHIEAHLFAAAMEQDREVEFPALGVVLSGGHTALVKMHSFGKFELLGQTLDDAIGESFDKVAKMLRLPYPGGPVIEKLAREGNPNSFDFRAGKVAKPYDFSFSGIKTKVLYTVYGQNGQIGEQEISHSVKCDVAASFQRAVFDDVVKKCMKAAEQYQCKSILMGGGVTNNRALRDQLTATGLNLYLPPFSLTLDNGAMIAGLAAWKMKNSLPHEYTFSTPKTRIAF